MTNRREFCIGGAAIGAALASTRAAGQQAKRMPRVALVGNFLVAEATGPEPINPEVRAFVRGLRSLGLVDGRTITIVRRSDEGMVERVPAIMKELVMQGVDVIVTSGGPAVWAAHEATEQIPIVGLVDDVLDMGIIDSLARPGHNLTGIGESDPMLHGKRLQLLKEAAPSISRVAVICYGQGPNDRGNWRRQLDAAGHAMKLEVLWLSVDVPQEFEAAFAAIVGKRADAIYATTTHVNDLNAKLISGFALKQRLPAFGFPEEGMLLGYWADYNEVFRRAAAYVKKILDGAKPGDLPFEQPTKFELIVNLRTAKALGLAIPRSMLLRASEVIE